MTACWFCGRSAPALGPAPARPWRARVRIAVRLVAAVAVLVLTAADALVAAAVGVRPLTVRIRCWARRAAAAYERAAHPDPDVVDAEVIEDEEVRVRR
jgi:hypothetical protein